MGNWGPKRVITENDLFQHLVLTNITFSTPWRRKCAKLENFLRRLNAENFTRDGGRCLAHASATESCPPQISKSNFDFIAPEKLYFEYY
jgi:hypothetical protein